MKNKGINLFFKSDKRGPTYEDENTKLTSSHIWKKHTSDLIVQLEE